MVTAGERRNVEVALALDLGVRNLVFNPPPHHVELPLERLFIQRLGGLQKDLLDVGLRTARHASNRRGVHRRVAPAHHLEALFGDDLFHHAFALQPLQLAHRQKDHAHRVAARRGQLHPQLGALLGKELVRNLNQHARAVARLRIAAAGSAVLQVLQHLDALLHDRVALLALDVGDKPETAGVMLVRRVIQTLRVRQSVGVLLHEFFVVPVLVVFSVVSHCSPVRRAPLSLSELSQKHETRRWMWLAGE